MIRNFHDDLTSILRPSTTVPWSFSLAVSASSFDAKVTKPKPLIEKQKRIHQVIIDLSLDRLGTFLSALTITTTMTTTYFWSSFVEDNFSIDDFSELLKEIQTLIRFRSEISTLKLTSNMAFKSSSRNRNGIFEMCKRFWVVFELVVVTLPLFDDEPLGVKVLVDWGE